MRRLEDLGFNGNQRDRLARALGNPSQIPSQELLERVLGHLNNDHEIFISHIENWGIDAIHLLDGFIINGRASVADEFLRLAANANEVSNHNVVADVATLGQCSCVTDYTNLRRLLDKINTGDSNVYREIQVAAQRASGGHTVTFRTTRIVRGGELNNLIIPEEADLIDHTMREMIQFKNNANYWDISGAANQLAGVTGANTRLATQEGYSRSIHQFLSESSERSHQSQERIARDMTSALSNDIGGTPGNPPLHTVVDRIYLTRFREGQEVTEIYDNNGSGIFTYQGDA